MTLNDIFISLEASIPPFLVSQVLEAICSALGKTKFWGHLTVGVMTDCRHLRSRDGLGRAQHTHRSPDAWLSPPKLPTLIPMLVGRWPDLTGGPGGMASLTYKGGKCFSHRPEDTNFSASPDPCLLSALGNRPLPGQGGRRWRL